MTSKRKTSKKTPQSKRATVANPAAAIQAKAEQFSHSIIDSAQQIWHAGVGAFARAQEEGTRMFEALVREGMNIEKSTRSLANQRVEAVRGAMGERVEHARERASDTWDRLEKVFEQRVQRALTQLGIPGSKELQDLVGRVNELNAQLRKLAGVPSKQAGKPKKPAAAKKASAKKVSAKKAASRNTGSVAKKTTRTAAKRAAKKTAAKPASVSTKLPVSEVPHDPGSLN